MNLIKHAKVVKQQYLHLVVSMGQAAFKMAFTFNQFRTEIYWKKPVISEYLSFREGLCLPFSNSDLKLHSLE